MTAPLDPPTLALLPNPSARASPGQEEVWDVPALEGHRGPGPALILRWNTPGVTETVDVVLHFHGFSGHGAAMNLVSDEGGGQRPRLGRPARAGPGPGTDPAHAGPAAPRPLLRRAHGDRV